MNAHTSITETPAGFAILHGNIAPDGCVIRLEGVAGLRFEGRARLFDDVTKAVEAVMNRHIIAGDMIVFSASLFGGTTAAEDISAAVLASGIKNVSLMCDSAIGNCPSNPLIGHVAPSAAKGGPIALVREGDTIVVDIAARTIHARFDMDARKDRATPPAKKAFGPLEKYQRLVSTAFDAPSSAA
jgi:dihydroxy-acid dehydratase